ncbi:hypothetical protein MCCPF38_00857 [Mycoplasma capricolum subsp. capripneumoniae]|nr:hypothetical protein MCCPF38_00857 [Mycoplasma capricolum subsp. capripneumoniae]
MVLVYLTLFFQQALISAYTNKDVLIWVKEFKEYVYNNYLYLKTHFLDLYKELVLCRSKSNLFSLN